MPCSFDFYLQVVLKKFQKLINIIPIKHNVSYYNADAYICKSIGYYKSIMILFGKKPHWIFRFAKKPPSLVIVTYNLYGLLGEYLASGQSHENPFNVN